MKKHLIGVLSVYGVLAASPLVLSDEATRPLIQSVAVEVSTDKMKEDNRGTDVRNIYTIVVERVDKKAEGPYNILYYLDGRYVEEFKSQTLPFSFTRNFKGQLDGAHEVRLDIENGDLKVVGRQVTVISVSHAPKQAVKR